MKMGTFARLAQATFLLSQALQSITSTLANSDLAHDDQTAQLRRTLLALVHAADSEATIRRLEFCAPSSVSLRFVNVLSPRLNENFTNGRSNNLEALSYYFKKIKNKKK